MAQGIQTVVDTLRTRSSFLALSYVFYAFANQRNREMETNTTAEEVLDEGWR